MNLRSLQLCSKKCPTCRKTAIKDDIRNIYAQQVIIVNDATEKLKEQLQTEKETNHQLKLVIEKLKIETKIEQCDICDVWFREEQLEKHVNEKHIAETKN